ncbi:MAG: 4Fe-4S dicluster domain-containing protein [Bacteroidales bacterium]|nr:4Fe-4S dicluster domain-containing protein [Bacteroidales bacterium]
MMILLYIFLLVLLLLLLLLFLPIKGPVHEQAVPVKHIDERDTMFSRNEIKPGEERFEDYYENRPENLEKDRKFRSEPGLLSPGAKNYHPFAFASAEASFEAVKGFFPYREKAGSTEQRAGGKEDTRYKYKDTSGEEEDKRQKEKDKGSGVACYETNNTNLSVFLKHWGEKMGAHSVGIAEMKDYHFYTHGGRGDKYGEEVHNKHKYGIAITVEMDHELTKTGPQAPVVMESARQYLNSGMIATQLALTLRNLGYEAKTHIDANYDVICPLVARDAGLGEIGRMGLLMTPKLGPRVRIAVVTTNAALKPGKPANDNTVIDFCIKCKKCAEVCPSASIPKGNREEHGGSLRWQINQESCFTYWCTTGTDCGRCMAVCPYSHKTNALHNFVRWGIRNNFFFRRLAVRMDDVFYGAKPRAGKAPGWIKGN